MPRDVTTGPDFSSSRHGIEDVRVMRLAGLGSGIGGFAGALLLFPIGANSLAQALVLAFGLVVLVNGLGFGMLDRLKTHGPRLAQGAMLSLPLALYGAGFGVPLALGVAGIVVAEFLVARRSVSVALAVLSALATLLMAPKIVTVGVLVAVLAPLMIRLVQEYVHARRPASSTRISGPLKAQMEAHLGARLRHSGGIQVLVDQAGLREALPDGAPFAMHLNGTDLGGPSLIDLCLVADRPALLHALGRAIHDGKESTDITLRLKRTEASGHAVWRAAIYPASGIAGRAIVMLDPEQESAKAGPGADPALIQRALHDFAAPFNAGIGYLEMLGDAALVPQDAQKRAHYAQEAAMSVRLAHRNTQLLGRWLRITERDSADPRTILPRQLVEDGLGSLRRINEKLIVHVEGTDALAPVLLDLETARFALDVFLRPLGADGGSLRVTQGEKGLVFEAMTRKAASMPDAVQDALEDAAMRHCGVMITRSRDGARQLDLPAVPVVAARGETPPIASPSNGTLTLLKQAS